MDNPCTRDCPERYPGCNCERRKAWKWQENRRKEARRREHVVDEYRRDKVRGSRRKHRRLRWDE